MNLELLDSTLTELALPTWRRQQVIDAIFSQRAGSWEEVTTLSKDLRATLEERIPWDTVTITDEQKAADRTIKIGCAGEDGRPFEAVLMEFDNSRHTACLSSQSGCALACTFCATGAMGYGRNLTRWEILDQYLVLNRRLERDGERIDNIVMMGMGEPFHNYDEVIAALRMINDPEYGGLGARRIAISTAGWIPGIKKLADEPRQFKLALSLHAPNDKLRTKLMPVTKKYPIADLMQALSDYRKTTRRRVFIEYLMLDGVNDTPEIAHELADLLGRTGYHVNLIAYNPTGSGYTGSPDERVSTFAKVLESRGIDTSYRLSRGKDIDAACGQLATNAQ